MVSRSHSFSVVFAFAVSFLFLTACTQQLPGGQVGQWQNQTVNYTTGSDAVGNASNTSGNANAEANTSSYEGLHATQVELAAPNFTGNEIPSQDAANLTNSTPAVPVASGFIVPRNLTNFTINQSFKYVFVSYFCPFSQKVLAYMNKTNLTGAPGLALVSINSPEGRNLYNFFAEAYNLSEKEKLVPLMYFNDTTTVGDYRIIGYFNNTSNVKNNQS